MGLQKRRYLEVFRIASLLILLFPGMSFGQQVVQRGPFGKPTQVLDETQQWTIPLLVSSDRDVEIYIPDVTTTTWLSRNYSDFQNRGTYTLSTFTLYRTVNACRANQISWGMGDAAHLDACNDIGYRVRQIRIDPNQKSAQILMAAMVDQDGQIDPESVQEPSTFRTWDQLGATTQNAILKTNEIVTRQMRIYDAKIHNDHSHGAIR
ncbi:hypothetical protein [Edaphobacter modestus]|uniref:Uncharacterized protein n=1 Tax=Edaphobacter modestus TaxID=388466 RepID=A0A4Q7YYC1_9BACT|nr:hypothetical protein [Edaphobacter modestus]RZU42972.1 hypothetical protein BDD14_4573 [Edaphobacter modestus]